jgi:electron transport complex protein RnfC
MTQHIGAPCVPLVSKNDFVKVGQLIGDSEELISAPVHSSVSGKVEGIEEILSVTGTRSPLIVIKTDKKQEISEEVVVPKVKDHKSFIAAIRKSGLVGLGGAAFPASIKYNPKNLSEVDTLIVNGAECEPYITSDYRAMLEDTEDIIEGIRHLLKYLDISNCHIAIEDNKPKAIEALTIASSDFPNINVMTIKSLYPNGAERVLIFEATGRILPPGSLPADEGVLVSNVATVAFISQYLKTGMPLINKRLTIDGPAVAEPKNIRALIGTRTYEMVDFCGGYKRRPRLILMGGPMMGRPLYDDGAPMIKNNNAILVYDTTAIRGVQPETACINCGKCVSACPLNLMPTTIMKAYEMRQVDNLKKLFVDICMECGSCSYVCPAKKQLSMINKLAKILLNEAEENV